MRKESERERARESKISQTLCLPLLYHHFKEDSRGHSYLIQIGVPIQLALGEAEKMVPVWVSVFSEQLKETVSRFPSSSGAMIHTRDAGKSAIPPILISGLAASFLMICFPSASLRSSLPTGKNWAD